MAALIDDDRMIELARQAALTSYSPYSGFRVGAVVITNDGTVYRGANVENASFPVSSCGEATTINYAVAQGVREIETVVVACIDTDDIELAYPCGRCRQIMSEFGTRRVLVAAGEGPHREHSLEELLPHGFRLG